MTDGSRARRRRGLFLALSAAATAALVAVACGDFRASSTGDGSDAGDAAQDGSLLSDSPSSDDTSTPGDGGVLDAPGADSEGGGGGDSPPDFACKGVWSNGADGGCAQRQVVVIEPGILDTTAMAVAVTGTKRVGVAYNSKLFADQGELHVASFGKPTGTTADGGLVPTPQIAVIAGSQFDNIGFVADIAAGATARLHVAYQSVPDNQFSYATIDETGPPSAGEAIATGIATSSHVSLGVLPNGDVRAVYYDPSQGTLFSKLRTVAAGWQASSQIPGRFEVDSGVPGVGHVSLVIDDVGSAHAAYDFSPISGESNATYSQFAGPLWGDPKAIENLTFVGQAGFDIALGLTGQTRHAAYFVVPNGVSTADLHLARWIGFADTPTIEILDQQIPSAAPPSYRVALATDPWGLLHVAILRPQDAGKGYLEYRRQQRVGGLVSWLSDIVDDNVLDTGSEQSLVDIAVDADGRPHIAYYRGTDLSICYATRFDR